VIDSQRRLPINEVYHRDSTVQSRHWIRVPPLILGGFPQKVSGAPAILSGLSLGTNPLLLVGYTRW